MISSVRSRFDSRTSGPRYWVTTSIDDETIAFQAPLDDPFVRCTVRVSWLARLRSLVRRDMSVTVVVGAGIEAMNDVLELDEDTLIAGRTRKAAFQQSMHSKLETFAREVITDDEP
jgi:hypothetical protein